MTITPAPTLTPYMYDDDVNDDADDSDSGPFVLLMDTPFGAVNEVDDADDDSVALPADDDSDSDDAVVNDVDVVDDSIALPFDVTVTVGADIDTDDDDSDDVDADDTFTAYALVIDTLPAVDDRPNDVDDRMLMSFNACTDVDALLIVIYALFAFNATGPFGADMNTPSFVVNIVTLPKVASTSSTLLASIDVTVTLVTPLTVAPAFVDSMRIEPPDAVSGTAPLASTVKN